MRGRPRTQDDASVPQRLMDAAEALYGEHGLDGVSLRQISLAAGTGNNYAVQYHFTDAAGLIRAVLEQRMPEVERLRALYLARAKEQGRLRDVRALMDILYMPLLELKNAAGERPYARFVLALLSSSAGPQHRADAYHLMPIADHVMDLIGQARPDLPFPLLLERQRQISIMVLTSVFNRRTPCQPGDFDAPLIDDAIEMATAALMAPVSPAMKEVLRRRPS